MPTYQYKREDGSVFEIMQKMSEPALRVCPDTGQNVSRVISGGAGVVYKGDGWYVTDYKDKKKPAKSETKSETKTESKAESTAAKAS